MKKPTISIVIPVYNAQSYISRTINSVINQTFKDFEIIIIDDGSTDDSLQICKEIIAFDNRISLYHKANGGVSSARNLGLEVATGEWICFIDSDDELLPDALMIYNNSMSDDIDIIRCGFERVKKSQTTIISTDDIVLSDKSEIISLCCESRYEAYLWNTCFRRVTIGNTLFNENFSYCEDHLFTFQVIAFARKVAFVSKCVYRYYAPDTSGNLVSNNLSARYLDPGLIMKEALLEYEVKMSCVNNKDIKCIKIIETEFNWKINHALKYAVIGNRYIEAVVICCKYNRFNIIPLLSLILHLKIAPYIKK